MLAQFSPTPPALDAVIELWYLDLDQVLPVRPEAVLSAAEEERASRFRDPRHALHYRNSHLQVRFGLACHLGIAPRAVRWESAARGKPKLAPATGLFFNLSHCDHFALAAFTAFSEVGVDIEPVGRMAEMQPIASSYFAAEEAEWVDEATTQTIKADRFLRLWTRKEAVMKATGEGLSDPLLAARVLDGAVPVPDGSGGLLRWRVDDLAPPFAAVAAVAALDGPWTLRSICIEPEDFSSMAERWN